jgi:hypothetical protein
LPCSRPGSRCSRSIGRSGRSSLHKASFLVWLGSVGLHVLVRIVRLPAALRMKLPGAALRLAIGATAVVAGLTVATLTLPAPDRLQDAVSGHARLDHG